MDALCSELNMDFGESVGDVCRKLASRLKSLKTRNTKLRRWFSTLSQLQKLLALWHTLKVLMRFANKRGAAKKSFCASDDVGEWLAKVRNHADSADNDDSSSEDEDDPLR